MIGTNGILGSKKSGKNQPQLHKDMIPHFQRLEVRKMIVSAAIAAGQNHETVKNTVKKLEDFTLAPFTDLLTLASADLDNDKK